MQCIIVKGGYRCTNDNTTFPDGLTLPIIRPDATVYICGVCIQDMYFAAHQVEHNLIPPDQFKREVGLQP